MNLLKKAPAEIRRPQDSLKELQLLQTLILSISQAGDVPTAIGMTLCNVCEMTGWSYGQAWQVRTDGSALECCPAWHSRSGGLEMFRKSVEMMTLAPGEGLAGQAWVFKEPVWTDDIGAITNSPLITSAQKAGFRASVGIPVLAGDQAVLVLEFFLFEPRLEDKSHIHLITAIAAQLGWLIQKKMAEEALRESVERFELAARGSRDGLWDAKIPSDRKGFDAETPMYYSRRFKQLLGFTDAEMLNTFESWRSRLHPEDQPRFMDALRNHLDKRLPYDVEYRLRVKSGDYRWFSGRGAAVWNATGLPVRMAGSLRDITDRKQMEQSLFQSEKIAAVGQLAAGIAHELNNPLHTILGYSQGLIQQIQEPEPVLHALRFIDKEARRCQSLVQNLLTFARQHKRGFTRIDPNAIIEEVLALIEVQARVNNITLAREVAPDLSDILVDHDQIRQALLNLCTNAIDAMPCGGTLTVRVARGESTAEMSKDVIRFEVEDTGEGIPEDIRHRIFEPFFTTKEVGKGTGLGLSLAYEIVKGHQGELLLRSELGKGTCFQIILPVEFRG